jgi:hypothetical protein
MKDVLSFIYVWEQFDSIVSILTKPRWSTSYCSICTISLIVLDCPDFKSDGFKVPLHRLLFASWESFLLSIVYCLLYLKTLLSDIFCSAFLLAIFVQKLIVPNFFHLLVIWKYIKIWSPLQAANLELIMIRYGSGMLKTVWNCTFRKLKLYHLHVQTTVSILISYCDNVVLVLPADCIKIPTVIVHSSLSLCYLKTQSLKFIVMILDLSP